MAKDRLSDRQKAMLDFIREFTEENGYPPTIRQIGEAANISSTSVVNYNLNKLEKAGYLTRDLRVSRGLRLVSDEPRSLFKVPLAGYIFAAEPVPVPGEFSSFAPDETIELTRDLLADEHDLFALRVRGNSMVDAMVNDGDIVVMKRQVQARNGEMVAVWLRDRELTTLKRFYAENGRIRLQPANPDMDPIYADPDNVEVQGKVVLVVRQMN
jgi:repressor LexA